jgi:hypothetical protein
MFTNAARSSPSYVKKRAARSQAKYAAKPLKQFSRVKKDTSNFANRAVKSAASRGGQENRAAMKLRITSPNRKNLHNRLVVP